MRKPADILELLSDTASRIRRGELDPRIGSTLGSLGLVMLRVFQAASIDARLWALETVINRTKQPVPSGPGVDLADMAMRQK